jgi:magnesium chelatase family protein
MLSKVYSCSVRGIDGFLVDVEVDISNGLPMFSIVGLPDNAIRESRDRVKAALVNSGYSFPNKRITVNLAPADHKKEGAGFDLPIAIALLLAAETIKNETINRYCIIGELSLDGSVKPVRGILPMVIAAKEKGLETAMVPSANSNEAAVVKGIKIIGVDHVSEAVEFCNGTTMLEAVSYQRSADTHDAIAPSIDYADVKGQKHAKRALEVAAAGGHNLLFSGPPGAGKTMLAQRLPTILPDLEFDEALEITKIYSVVQSLSESQGLQTVRPFRAPHHTISDAGLIGGGTYPRPGEISLAHHGVLFLDELPEFSKHVLETLRQPLEDGYVTVARANMSVTYPSNFMLVCSLNPCPCGYYGDRYNRCSCSPSQIQRYHSKMSGPLLDRIDITLDVPAVKFNELQHDTAVESSAVIRERVNKCRKIQQKRFESSKEISCNAQMGSREITEHCTLDSLSERLIEKSMEKLGLSARGYHRILKIARTIADLSGDLDISTSHVAEAIQYRRMSFIQ